MEKKETLRDEVEILEAVANTYHALYVADLRDGSFEEKGRAAEWVEKIIGSSGKADVALEGMCRSIVAPEYVEEMRCFTDFSTLNERLRDTDWLSKQFPSIHNKWCEGSFIVARRDAEGNCQKVIWAVRNIDQLKQAELAQRAELEKQNRELRYQLNIINAIAKTYRTIHFVNLKENSFVEVGVKVQHVHEIIGTEGEAQAALERMCQYLVVPEQREEMQEFSDLSTLQHRLQGKLCITKQFLSALGGWLEGTFVTVDRDAQGNLVNFLWVTKEIDEVKKKEMAYQKALEKAMRDAETASKAKTAFLFNMSHDIRTPMNAIMGYIELLRKHQGEIEKCDDYLEKIHSSSEFLLTLINNVLEMARIESGKTVLDESVCNINEISDEIVNVFSEQMSEKNITFSRSFKLHTSYIFCDRVKVDEVFLNLISNAYKYTPEGGRIEITVEELPCERPGYIYVKSTVADSGIGMSKEYLPVMFDDFTRERTATETKIQGTGLGLPIVKRLVELMDGTITVQSEPGRGTTFEVTIPHRIAAAPAEQSKQAVKTGERCFKGKRILLAEDNELNAEIAMEILQDEGIQVELAQDGIICVDMLQQAPDNYYDLILMDIQMPNMNGYKATEVIRHLQDPCRRDIPVIAMTANVFDEDMHNAIMAGMNGHLAKPIEIDKMLATLAEFLL